MAESDIIGRWLLDNKKLKDSNDPEDIKNWDLGIRGYREAIAKEAQTCGPDFDAVTDKYQNLNFVQRALYPSNYPVIENPDGSVSTHLLAAEKDEDGNWFVFPTIIQDKDGSLVKLPLRVAQGYAMRTGEVIPFGTDKEGAIAYSQSGLIEHDDKTEPGVGMGSRAGAEPYTPGPETTLGGMAGATIRGLGPYAAGAAVGAGVGSFLLPLIGTTLGAKAGMGAVLLMETVGPLITSAVNKLFDTDIKDPNVAINELATRAGIEEPDSVIERGWQAAVSGLGTTGGSMGLGTLMRETGKPVVGRIGAVMEEMPVQQLPAGAAAAVGAEFGGLPGGIAGGMLGGKAASLARARTTPARLKEAATRAQTVREAREMGMGEIPTSTVFGPAESAAASSAQTFVSKIPVLGTAKTWKKLRHGRVGAVNRLLRRYGSEESADVLTNEVTKELSYKWAKQLNKYTDWKDEVIRKLSAKKEVPVHRTVVEINRQIKALTEHGTRAAKPVIAKLKDWRDKIVNKNLSGVELMREEIGGAFKALHLAESRTLAEKAKNAIYGPLREDMASFIKQFGTRRDYKRWDFANKQLHSMIGELESKAFARVLNQAEMKPENIRRLMFSKDPSDIERIYRNQTIRGKRLMRSAVLVEAAEKATDIKEGGIARLSPTKFAERVQKTGHTVGVVFEEQAKRETEGLIRALKATQFAEGAKDVAPSSVMLAHPVVGYTLRILAAPLSLFARIYESRQMRDILIQFSKLEPGASEKTSAALAKRFITITEQIVEANPEMSLEKLPKALVGGLQ